MPVKFLEAFENASSLAKYVVLDDFVDLVE